MKKIFLLVILLTFSGCSAKNDKEQPEANFRYGTSNVYKRLEGFSTPDVVEAPVQAARYAGKNTRYAPMNNRAGRIQSAVEKLEEVKSAEVVVTNDSAIISVTLNENQNSRPDQIRNAVKLKAKASDRDLHFISVMVG